MRRDLSLREVRRLDDPKVAILPNAPARRVQQNFNRAATAEGRKLREAWPTGRYVDPQMREARERAKAMQEIVHTPELLVLLMILDTLPIEQRQAMIVKLAPAAVAGGAARQAVEVIRSTTLTFGQQWDLIRAQDELRSGGDL